MRAVFNSIMVALVVAALFWGTCLSCPQLLLAQHKHGCCPHSKTSASDCQTQVLKSFVKAEKAAVAVATVAGVVAVASAPVAARADSDARAVVELSPPLRTALRI